MRLFFKDPLFDAQLIRAMNHVYYNGADVGECITTASRIKEKDTESWYTEWNKTAERLYAEAKASEKAGHRVSAGEAYLKASNYYRTSYIFLYHSSPDSRLKINYGKQKEAFQKACVLLNYQAEAITIPYGNTNLPGYFLKVDSTDVPRPTIIITGGYDCSAEELYFFSAAAALKRGYNCVIYDGPGQGGALIEQGLCSRPDWENVVTPVVDYLLTRKEIKPECIALMGISFGGYLAPRAVTREHRISACIADPAQSDLYEAIQTRMPSFLLKYLQSNNSFKQKIANSILNSVIKNPVKGWSLRRGLFVHGVNTVKDYINISRQYNIKGIINNIKCPVLVCDAENDEIAAFAKEIYDSLSCTKAYIKFTNAEGAGEHCEDGNRSLFNQRAFDWLDEVYNNK